MITFEKALPKESILNDYSDGAYYVDSHQFRIEKADLTPIEVYCEIVKSAPKWSNILLSLRNRFVTICGLKDVGNFGNFENKNAKDFVVGDRIDLFYIREIKQNEIIVGLDDKHLDVSISIVILPEGSGTIAYLSTLIHVHNFLGKVYMGMVTPFHTPIIHSMISNAYGR